MRIAATLAAAVCLCIANVALCEKPSDAERQKAYDFEKTLFVGGGLKDGKFTQRPEAEQRPLVEAYVKSLATTGEKIAFLDIGYARYVYAINKKVYGEYAVLFLNDADPDVRRSALCGISYNQLRAYEREVEPLLVDKDPNVRAVAAPCLANLVRHDLAPRFADLANSAALDSDRIAGLSALCQLAFDKSATPAQHQAAVKEIEPFLDPKSKVPVAMQQGAIACITRLPEIATFAPKLIALAASDDLTTRQLAFVALEKAPGPESTAAAVAALLDPAPSIRSSAAHTLGVYKDKAPHAAVAKLLDDRDAWVRKQAIDALAMMESAKDIDAIAARLSDQNERVREAAVSALGVLKAKQHIAKIVALLSDKNDDVRIGALRAICDLGTRPDAAAAAALAGDSNRSIRLWIIRVVEKLDARDQEPVLETLAKDTDKDVAFEAQILLNRWKAR